MEKIEIIYNQLEEAIAVMKEVARWGREQGFRVWLDEWLTPDELFTDEIEPENFCIGKVDGKTISIPSMTNIQTFPRSYFWP